MSNKQGFTLVELMVVIVIIGILAAVAMPRFSDAIKKSRAAEAPAILGQISSAEHVHQSEYGTYVRMAKTYPGNTEAVQAFSDTLGLNVHSDFIAYEVLPATTTTFVAKAYLVNAKWEANGNYISINQDGVKNNHGVDAAKYIPTWY